MVELDLVLHVQAGLGHGVVPAIQPVEIDRRAVGRGVQVDDRVAAVVLAGELAVEVVVIQADDQGVLERPGVELGLGDVIHPQHLVVLLPVDAITGHVALVIGPGQRVGDKAVAVQRRAVMVVDIGVAHVLLEGPDLIQAMGQLIAEHELFAVIGVDPRLAEEQVAADLAVDRGHQGADARQALGLGHIVVFLVLGEQGQAGVVIRPPGQAGGDELAFLLDVIDRRAAVVGQGGQAIEELPLFVQGPAQVQGQAFVVIAAAFQYHLMQRRGGGALADHVDDTARLVLPVQHRRRALEHLDALQGIGLDLQGAAGAAAAIGQVQAVQVQRGGREAARGRLIKNLHPVGETAAGHAWGVAQGFGDSLGAAGLDLGGGDHVDRLRDFHQRRVGLTAGGAALGDDTGHRAPGAFYGLGGADLGRAQLQRAAFRRRLQQPATARLQCLQTGPGEQVLQPLGNLVTPLQPGATLALGHLRVHRQQNPRRTGKLIEGLVEATAGDAVGARLALAGFCGLGHAGQQRRQRQQAGEQATADGGGQSLSGRCRLVRHSGTPHENAS